VKIDATVKQIRALLRLAELDQGEHAAGAEADDRSQEAAPRGVPRGLLERYQSLVDAGRIPAVVAIEGGACSGCHVRLPTMIEYQARHSPALYVCPSCRRMLYSPEGVREDSHAKGA
jgi:uncharacterized protein